MKAKSQGNDIFNYQGKIIDNIEFDAQNKYQLRIRAALAGVAWLEYCPIH